MTTIGLSPKLYPALAAIAAGILLAVFVDREIGLTILGTGVALLTGGYVAPPGEIAVNADPRGNGPGPVDESQLGYTVLELAIVLLVLVILVVLLARLL